MKGDKIIPGAPARAWPNRPIYQTHTQRTEARKNPFGVGTLRAPGARPKSTRCVGPKQFAGINFRAQER
jgi:hypothetical protein